MKKKLKLNKKTIVSLSNESAGKVAGGSAQFCQTYPGDHSCAPMICEGGPTLVDVSVCVCPAPTNDFNCGSIFITCECQSALPDQTC